MKRSIDNKCLRKGEDPLLYYHATPTRNLPSIMRQGLRPGDGAVFETRAWSQAKVFLAQGLSAGRMWLEFVNEMTTEACTLLAVQLTLAQQAQLQVDAEARAEGDQCAFYTHVVIPPNALRVVAHAEAIW